MCTPPRGKEFSAIAAAASAAAAAAAAESPAAAAVGVLRAGVAKADITDPEAAPPAIDVSVVAKADGEIDNPMYAKVLLIQNGNGLMLGFVTLDVVSYGQIGHIPGEFLPSIRSRIQHELGWDPSHLIFNVNHGHGVPCADVEERTFKAVAAAFVTMAPVSVGSGRGTEARITENRRMHLKDGSESDVRGAYSLAPDDTVESIGPIDPSIGVLRLDLVQAGGGIGDTLAVVYNFACHPIMGTPSGSNGADITGFASQLIEDGFNPGLTQAFFLQGCSGDVNPIGYKEVDRPKDAEPLGLLLGQSVLQAAKAIPAAAMRTDCELHASVQRLQVIHNARIDNVGKAQSCMVSKSASAAAARRRGGADSRFRGESG